MAEAGFYHTPSSNEPDLVTCYVCYKEMDGWEPTDDPWYVISFVIIQFCCKLCLGSEP